MMRLDPRLFKSRLAWRFFGTFVACALVPTIVLAAVSYYRVTRQLEDQAIDRLRQSAKTYALSVYERLVLADGLLQNIEALLTETKGRPMPLSAIMTEQSQTVFSGVTLFRGEKAVPVWGPEMAAVQEAATRYVTTEAKTIFTIAGDEKWCKIALVRRLSAPGEGNSLLVATISPSFLWGLEQGTVLASGIEFGIWDDQGRSLFSSLDSPVALMRTSKAGGADMPGGPRRLDIQGEPYYGYCWSAFLKPRFHVPYWTVMVLESRDHVLQPLHHFRTVFPLIVLLSLVVVAWLSSRAIRRSLVPIDSLMEGAKHVAAHRFDHYVAVRSKDEFQELAIAFNRMTDQLGAQFKTLEARSDLDRAILSLLDMEQIVMTSLSHLSLFLPHRAAAISIMDTENDLEGRSFIREENDRGEVITIEPFSLSTEEQEVLIQNPAWTLVEASGPCPAYLASVRRPGVRVFAVFPVWVKSRLFALVSLAMEVSAEPEPKSLEQVRGFSDHLAVALSNSDLIRELKELNLGTLHALARTVDAKSPWTAGHSLRVAQVAGDIGEAMALSQRALDELQRAALLHDIGKIGVPSSILDKKGKLTEEEYDVVKGHPSLGGRILAPVRAYAGIIPAVEQHHERYDGKGYPSGVRGEAIDLMARILSVADAFDAMVSDRPYRRGFEDQQAVKIILDEAGSQFDPRVVEAFKKVVGRILEYSHRSRVTAPSLANQTAPFSVSPARQESGVARAHNGR